MRPSPLRTSAARTLFGPSRAGTGFARLEGMNRKQQTAIVFAGAAGVAAAGVAAAWLGRRHLRLVRADSEPVSELPDSAPRLSELRRAEPRIAEARETEPHIIDPRVESLRAPLPLQVGEPEQTEGYDAVDPEALGSVWLERAMQTADEPKLSIIDASLAPEVEDFLISEASRRAARSPDDIVEDNGLELDLSELDDLDELDGRDDRDLHKP